MRFIREDIPQDGPSFREWVYGPPSELTPPVDPTDTTCYGPCCADYYDDDCLEDCDDCFD